MFNLNISDYTIIDLISVFDLPNNYTSDLVETRGAILTQNILKNCEINNHTKNAIIDFVANAKELLNRNNVKSDIYNTNYTLIDTQLQSNDHAIQSKPNTPYINSRPNEFVAGIINPLNKKIIKKNLNIDTRFRENYYSTMSTNYNLKLPINIDNVVQMQLSAIELPTTYYVISKQYNNNFFTITVNGVTETITLQSGNYTSQDIITAINMKLSNSIFPINNVSFAINLSGETGSNQTIIAPTSTDIITDITIDFKIDSSTPLPLSLGWLLGFRNGVYTGSLNYVSEGVVDIFGPKYFYLVIDDYNNNVNNNFYSAFNSSILNKNILARISPRNKKYDILELNSNNIIATPRDYFGPVNLSTFNIQLLDEYGRIVDLNNMDFSFCLTLTTIYDL